ncbi:endonuclease/exonuclease/phosphatase family protein [Mesomycoplasma ovipneumoniae]|uniref:Membrane nuclease A (MnuA) n=1 Tax=Mesomycoplasma ovipneumoniae 14811 TaxID=1188239 RepID=A0A014L606_9BACT|nr:endonuclease/exonuclease/phosphatase family protein [Mesomycoplasma ovipneumoniae]EXU60904.1 Membrane nuclease A (MnuA) [Mesomycoplasma ovipneumoniae 14811]
MKKSILFPLIFAGSAAAIGAAGYYIYSTSTGEQNGTGVIINKSETLPKNDLSTSNDEAQKQDQNQEKIQEPEKNVEKDSSSLSDETQKQEKNQQKSPESKKNLQNNNIQSIRVGFWNVLNYTNKSKNPNSAKTYALANVINSSGSDVVGLAEITSTGDGTDIIKELEKLNPSAGWKEITTNKYGKERQQEKYTFLYKSSLLETINFEPNSNPYLIQEGKNLTWARPVAAVKFQTKTNIKNDFTLAIGHFDAPGNKSKSRKEKTDSEAPGQGEQEANEARDLANVLAEIDKKDGPNNEIIFMGDTNIRTENTDKLFKSTLESYRLLLDKDEKTSLSSKNFGEYANSYDKIFYKGDLKTKNAKKYNIFSIFEKNVVDLEQYDKMRKKDGRSINYKTTNPKDINRIRGISDHTMVYFDLELSESDKD